MSDNPLKISLNINEAARDLTGFLVKFKENRTYNKASYEELLTKYIDALKLIDVLKEELEAAQANKMPSLDEIESMGKALDMIDQFSDALPKLAKLQQSVNSLQRG